MPSFTLKGIPPDLYRRLKRSAAEHRRSVNSEVLVLLERALNVRQVDVERSLARIDALRNKLRVTPLTERKLRKAKREGRP
jgi:plasmid stability protein